jgi:hypothetical protein
MQFMGCSNATGRTGNGRWWWHSSRLRGLGECVFFVLLLLFGGEGDVRVRVMVESSSSFSFSFFSSFVRKLGAGTDNVLERTRLAVTAALRRVEEGAQSLLPVVPSPIPATSSARVAWSAVAAATTAVSSTGVSAIASSAAGSAVPSSSRAAVASAGRSAHRVAAVLGRRSAVLLRGHATTAAEGRGTHAGHAARASARPHPTTVERRPLLVLLASDH